jgi:hypothetical protein
VEARQLAAEVKAEAGAWEVIGLRGRDPAEAGEKDWQVLRGDAESGVCDAHPCNASATG